MSRAKYFSSVTLVKSNAKALSAEPKVHCALRGFKAEYVSRKTIPTDFSAGCHKAIPPFSKENEQVAFCAYPPDGRTKKNICSERDTLYHTNKCLSRPF